MKKPREILAVNIRRLRSSNGFSQLDLAEAAGVSHRSIQNAEAEKVIQTDTLEAIAAAMKVTVAELYTDAFETQSTKNKSLYEMKENEFRSLLMAPAREVAASEVRILEAVQKLERLVKSTIHDLKQTPQNDATTSELINLISRITSPRMVREITHIIREFVETPSDNNERTPRRRSR